MKLLDCTLRDGGYYNAWDFSDDLVRDYLAAMDAASVDYVEIGFRSPTVDGFRGAYAYSSDEFLKRIKLPDALKIGVMINAKEFQGPWQEVQETLSQIFSPADQSPVKLVRIACNYNDLASSINLIRWIKGQGYEVGVNLMQITGNSDDEIKRFCVEVGACDPDVIYFADSFGNIDGDGLREIVETLRTGWSGAIGFHAHDNMEKALTNVLAALDAGVTWVDATVCGMGRGAGNAKTESLVIQLMERRSSQVELPPLLALISRHFDPLRKKYKWGSNPYYYLSAKFGIHPTFVQSMLSSEQYDGADLLTVIEYFKNSPGDRFSTTVLGQALQYYDESVSGCWTAESMLAEKEILILAPGQSVQRYQAEVGAFIRKFRPVVMAFNAHTQIDENLVNLRVASHPLRLVTDAAFHRSSGTKLVCPFSKLPKESQRQLRPAEVCDFGLGVASDGFRFGRAHVIAPSSLVMAYALGVAASGKARQVYLAGFDGYGAGDPRQSAAEEIIQAFNACPEAPELISLTETPYDVSRSSVFALNARSSQ